ncbi:hypothetical protein MIND_00470600 [Mycena indigotica]|uniref:Seipin n=1 Tax=Mycena indigotica TaxID=2126181 RepID=A0A8H6WBX9_9AGAR|nr:uncharacterized protein MIND_00470600 [Mycena indigotica]KAF7306789.1 hypothetical protein MIND_00470600 [Mycena indigotica]
MLLPSTRSLVSSVWFLLRPTLPLLVFLSLIPLISLLSASAGWIVWKNAAVSWRTTLYLQYGYHAFLFFHFSPTNHKTCRDGLPPYAHADLPPLVSKQRYDMSLDLQVPNIDSNFALGNFMAGLTLTTRSNKTIISVRRPAIVVPPRLGLMSRRPAFITVHIPLLTSYATGTSNVVADVEIGRRDHWKSLGSEQGRELSVVSATLNGVVVHHGLRGLVTRFPLLTALISACIFMAISSIVVGICVIPMTFRRPTSILEIELEPVAEEVVVSSASSDSSESSEEKPSILRRRTSSRAELKLEELPTPILIPNSNTIPLRRRRSKLVDPVSSDSDS